MRVLLLLMLLLPGCYHSGYAGHHHGGWHHSSGYWDSNNGRSGYGDSHIQHPRHDAPPSLTPLEAVRKGRAEGVEKVRRAFAPTHHR